MRTIATFGTEVDIIANPIRLNLDMAKWLVLHASSVRTYEGRYACVTFENAADNVYNDILNELRLRGYLIESGYVVYPTGEIELYLSFSQLDKTELAAMTASAFWSTIMVDGFDSDCTPNPSQPLLQYHSESQTFMIEGMREYSRKKEQFIESLAGHDFYYSYSDSLSVVLAGERRTKELKAAGLAMGLTQPDVDYLYKQTMRGLTTD